MAQREGRFEDALVMLRDALRLFPSLGDRFHASAVLSKITSVLASTKQARAAAQLLGRAEALREEVGIRPVWLEKVNQGTLAILHAELDEAAFAEAWEVGRAMTLDEAVALALEP
jgi:hypothetical protein